MEFTYVDGKTLDPEMALSTGRQDLDAAMLQQVAGVKVPGAFGPHAKEPHIFALNLNMPSPMGAFECSIVKAIDAKKIYPKEALMHGDQGPSTISFDYADGKTSNVTVFKPSGSGYLNAGAIQAVSHAQMPPPPAWLTIRPLHLRVMICYSLNNSAVCPLTKQVIEVVNASAADQIPSPPCGP